MKLPNDQSIKDKKCAEKAITQMYLSDSLSNNAVLGNWRRYTQSFTPICSWWMSFAVTWHDPCCILT